MYQLQIEAHNVAGSSKTQFTFITLTKEGGELFSCSSAPVCDAFLCLAVHHTQSCYLL